jgi:hypothetical protein
MKSRLALFTALLITLGACSSTPKVSEVTVGPRLEQKEYASLVEKYTVSDKQYDGFYAKFEVYATLLNTDVQTAVLQKTMDTLQANSLTAQKEREKLFQENSNSTKVFLSFFTPTRRVNDLAKGNTLWKIYLEANGEKYEGKATKRSTPYEALVMMFPHHSRWAIPYDVTFPVPLSAVEKSDSYFIITSSLGSTRMKFPAVSGGGLTP